MGLRDRLKKLKFISNIFALTLTEIKDTLGEETLTMIFRRVGETTGEKIVTRFKGKYTTLDEFCGLLISQIIEPIIGEGKASYSVSGDKVSFELQACPYKIAGGFPIKDMSFFCHYTEGMIDIALKEALPDKNLTIEPSDLISGNCSSCKFSTI